MAVEHGVEVWLDCCCCWSVPRRVFHVPAKGRVTPLLPRGVLAASSAPPDLSAALQSAQSLGKLRVQVLLLGILEASQDPVPSTGCTGVSELSVLALYGIKHSPSLCSSQCGG